MEPQYNTNGEGDHHDEEHHGDLFQEEPGFVGAAWASIAGYCFLIICLVSFTVLRCIVQQKAPTRILEVTHQFFYGCNFLFSISRVADLLVMLYVTDARDLILGHLILYRVGLVLLLASFSCIVYRAAIVLNYFDEDGLRKIGWIIISGNAVSFLFTFITCIVSGVMMDWGSSHDVADVHDILEDNRGVHLLLDANTTLMGLFCFIVSCYMAYFVVKVEIKMNKKELKQHISERKSDWKILLLGLVSAFFLFQSIGVIYTNATHQHDYSALYVAIHFIVPDIVPSLTIVFVNYLSLRQYEATKSSKGSHSPVQSSGNTDDMAL